MQRPFIAPDIDRLISAVYDGAMESPPWQKLLELLREQLQATSATLVLQPPCSDNSGVIIHAGANDMAAKESYEKRFFASDPFVRLAEGSVVTVEELLGSREWLNSPIYLDYMRQIDVRHIIGSDIYSDGVECRLRFTRPHAARPFADTDKALIQLLLPHLKRAIQLHARIDSLEGERQVFAGTVNHMPLGIICFAQNGEIVETNPEAQRILAEKDGLRLSGHSLHVDNQQERRELHRLIQQAITNVPPKEHPGVIDAMPITRPSGRSRLGVMVRALQPAPWSENRLRPAAMVFVRDPESSTAQPSSELVRRLYGLTRVEATLALLLVQGLTLDEAGEKMNIRRNTSRTHLRAIFCKTGVTRQTLLVKLLLNSVVTLN